MRHRKLRVHTPLSNRIVSKLIAVREFCVEVKAGIAAALSIASLLGVGLNLALCMKNHGDIEKLKRAQESQQQIQQQQKTFVPSTVARKFSLF